MKAWSAGIWLCSYFRSSQKEFPSSSDNIDPASIDADRYDTANDETKVAIEHAKVKETLQQYSNKDDLRFRRDDNQPEITLPNNSGGERIAPQSHVALYRLERRVIPDTARTSPDGWKIHGLYLWVHADFRSAGSGCSWVRLHDFAAGDGNIFLSTHR